MIKINIILFNTKIMQLWNLGAYLLVGYMWRACSCQLGFVSFVYLYCKHLYMQLVIMSSYLFIDYGSRR